MFSRSPRTEATGEEYVEAADAMVVERNNGPSCKKEVVCKQNAAKPFNFTQGPLRADMRSN
jgi:hypothetical protein